MQIYINRHKKKYGPYSLDDTRNYLASGHLQPSDLAWYEGANEWLPLNQIPGVIEPERRLPPPPLMPPPPAIAPDSAAVEHASQFPPHQTTAGQSNLRSKQSQRRLNIWIGISVFLGVYALLAYSTMDREQKYAVPPEQAKVKLTPAQKEDRRKQRLEQERIAAQQAKITAQKEREQKAQQERKQKAADKAAAEKLEKQKKAVKAFANFLNNGDDGQLFSGYEISGNNLTLQTGDSWYILPRHSQMDRLKAFHIIWAKVSGSLDEPMAAPVILITLMGDKIGGCERVRGCWVD